MRLDTSRLSTSAVLMRQGCQLTCAISARSRSVICEASTTNRPLPSRITCACEAVSGCSLFSGVRLYMAPRQRVDDEHSNQATKQKVPKVSAAHRGLKMGLRGRMTGQLKHQAIFLPLEIPVLRGKLGDEWRSVHLHECVGAIVDGNFRTDRCGRHRNRPRPTVNNCHAADDCGACAEHCDYVNLSQHGAPRLIRFVARIYPGCCMTTAS